LGYAAAEDTLSVNNKPNWHEHESKLRALLFDDPNRRADCRDRSDAMWPMRGDIADLR
jgi:hypothetical protein